MLSFQKTYHIIDEFPKIADATNYGNYSDTKISIEEQAKWIIFAAANMIAFGIFGDKITGRNFLLRCGIAKGDLKIGRYDINGLGDKIEIGNSMAYAYQLESSQNWIGGAVYGNIDCGKFMDYLVEYKPPLKKKYKKNLAPKDIPKYAIDWIKVAKERADDLNLETDIDITYICNKIKSIAKSISKKSNKKVRKKINKTKKFVKYYLR